MEMFIDLLGLIFLETKQMSLFSSHSKLGMLALSLAVANEGLDRDPLTKDVVILIILLVAIDPT